MMLQVEIYNSEMIKAHSRLIERYIEIIKNSNMSEADRSKWINFCITALSLKNADKLSRWVGFIQGILFSNGLITIEEERNFSRDIYKPIYEQWGLDSKTVSI